MKKAMLFIIALLFTVSANAASINISVFDTVNADVLGIFPNDANTAVASAGTEGGSFIAEFDVTTTEDTWAIVEWTFNPEATLDFASVAFDGTLGAIMAPVLIAGDFATYVWMAAGETYFFDIAGEAFSQMGFQLSVSAVPVPAALFLFAPALLGFLGLRRKSAMAVAT